MMRQMFINLPVESLANSAPFYTALGFRINPLFSDESQQCFVWSDAVYVMLQTSSFFYAHEEFNEAKPSHRASHTLLVTQAIEVDELVAQAIGAGGTETAPSVQEPFMHLRTVVDLDGHIWGIMYLDIPKFKSEKGR